jgi:5-formyltetrahydrofolate cyclo-ligase
MRASPVIVEAVTSDGKAALRRQILRARRALPATQRAAEAQALREQVRALGLGGVTVCAYVPVGSEPGSIELLDDLHGSGVRVLLPVAGSDADGTPQPLRWGRYVPGALRAARYGLQEPAPPWLDPTAVADAAVVLVPALAVDRRGTRLGRGAGFYDRSLPLAAGDARLIAVVRDDELLDELPAEPHDVPMTHVLTPAAGLRQLPLPMRESGDPRGGSST